MILDDSINLWKSSSVMTYSHMNAHMVRRKVRKQARNYVGMPARKSNDNFTHAHR